MVGEVFVGEADAEQALLTDMVDRAAAEVSTEAKVAFEFKGKAVLEFYGEILSTAAVME